MIKALIKERTMNIGPFDAVHWLIFDLEEISGAVHVQAVVDAVVPVDGKELVGRNPGERLLMKDPVDCYTFLAMMGVYNKDGKLEDIRVSDQEHQVVGNPDGTHSHIPPAGSGEPSLAELEAENVFQNASKTTYEE